jgi:hypothetical protein
MNTQPTSEQRKNCDTVIKNAAAATATATATFVVVVFIIMIISHP